MSITAYWKATTGFNVTDYPVKLGKPVADCSVAELTANPMCGSISQFANVSYTATADEILNSNIRYVGGAAGFTYPITSEHSETWAIAGKPSDDIRKQYRRTIFVACPSNVSMPAYFISENTDSRILIVEDIKDPNKLVINYGNTTDYGDDIYRTVNFKISSVQCRHTCNRGQTTYNTAPNQVDYEDPDTHTHTYYNIYPVWVYIYENEAYVVLWEYLCFFGGRYKDIDPAENNFNFIQQGNFQSFSQTTPKWLAMGYNPNNGNNNTTLHDIFPNGYADPVPTPAQFVNPPQIYPTTNLAPDGAGVVYGLQMTNNVLSGTYTCRLDISLYTGNQWYRTNTMCRAGCYFVNNGELLKPIIQNGIVIGYGTPEEESEIDSYRDLKHPVPSGPSGGGGGSDVDDIDPNEFGIDSYTGGVASYYLMTPQELRDLITDFYTRAESGMTFSNNIICCFACVDDIVNLVGVDTHPITIHNSAQDTPFVSTASYGEIAAIVNPILGSVTVPRKNNCFLDFSPYTNYELFVPTIGWLSLPDTVVGRSIDVRYFIDITTCRATAIVDNNGVVMAQGSGSVGAAVPLAVIESGVLAGANIQSAASVFSSALQAGAGFGSGNIGFGLSGVGNLAQNAAQLVVDGNTNYTMVKGSGGDASQFGAGHYCQLKITHPVSIVKPDEDPMGVPNFGHTVGYLCYKTGTLRDFSGFTVCYNPHITGINATDAEKEEIRRLLESGVIL